MNIWRTRARQLKTEIYARYLAAKDPRLPWATRVFVFVIVVAALIPLGIM